MQRNRDCPISILVCLAMTNNATSKQRGSLFLSDYSKLFQEKQRKIFIVILVTFLLKNPPKNSILLTGPAYNIFGFI